MLTALITILKHTPRSAVEARRWTQRRLAESFTLKITAGSKHLNRLQLDGVQTHRRGAAAVRAEAESVRTGAELSWAAPGRFVCVLVGLSGTCSSTCSSTCSDMTAAHPGLGVTNISCHIWARLQAAWRRGWLDSGLRRRPSSLLPPPPSSSLLPAHVCWTCSEWVLSVRSGCCSGRCPCGCPVIYALMSEGLQVEVLLLKVWAHKCIRSWAGRRKKKKPGLGSSWVCLRALCPTLPPCSAVWAASGCSSPPLWSPCAASASSLLPGLLRTSWGTATTSRTSTTSTTTTTTTRTPSASACCGTARSLWTTCTGATPSGDWANSQRSPPAPGR